MFCILFNFTYVFNNLFITKTMRRIIDSLENMVFISQIYLYTLIISVIIIVTLLYRKKIYLYLSKFFLSLLAVIKALFTERKVQKITEHQHLDRAIATAGYAYDKKQDIFYSKMNAWQREMGYCRLYDEAASVFGMVIDSEPIFFEYENKKWLIEFWKGQYDLTCGAEVGVYTSGKKDINVAGVFEGTFYDCASNQDMLDMKFILMKDNKTIFTRSARHWWLTGFRLGEFAKPSQLKMKIEITLKDREMRNAFINGLLRTGYTIDEFQISNNIVLIEYSTPKTKQPVTRNDKTDDIILNNAQMLCETYQSITSPYDTMPEKVSAVMEEAPYLYKHIINIGKNEQIFFKSDIIRNYAGGDLKEKIMTELTNVYNNAKQISYNNSSKFVIMSDVHRGVNKKHDDFAKNKELYLSVLKRYYNHNFTYIELGDGEELWENHSMTRIINANLAVYLQLKEFYNKNRLYFIYGNHDMVKQNQKFIEENLYQYYDADKKEYKELFKGIRTYEAIVLKHEEYEDDIFLLHGHQVDFINNKLWWLARFLVRYLWRPLQHIGIKDPTRTAQVYEKKKAVERKLTEWIIENKAMIISGHTHKPMFSDFDTPAYFNDGSCVSTGGITAIEIENGEIFLVKWSYKTNKDGKRIRKREVIAGPIKIEKYFSQEINKQKNTA